MIIGVPKEIKNNENRVGMTPAGVAELVKKGHTVYMQATAGINSGFSDDDYIAVGAQILPTIEDVYAIADGQFPKSSSDNSIIRWTSWPQKGTAQQVEIKLKKESDVESVSVYWYDDQGGVQVPASWDMEYQVNGQWNKFRLYSTDHYGILPDQFNMVHPAEAIKADALRLHIKPKPDSAVGILEVVIE